MKQVLMSLMVMVLSIFAVSANAAASLPSCPSLEEIHSVRFDSTGQKMLSRGFNALPDNLYSFNGHQWIVILSGLENASVRQANQNLDKIDTRESDQAKQEYLITVPVLACQYHASESQNLRIVAIPFFNTIDIL